MRDLTMENPIRAIREIAHDVSGRRKVRLANGREASALDIQSEYLAKARDFVDRREISTPVIEQALDLWERGLKAVESDDLGLVDREIDWVIKWKLIEAYRAKHGLSLGHPRIAQLDLAYHDIRRLPVARRRTQPDQNPIVVRISHSEYIAVRRHACRVAQTRLAQVGIVRGEIGLAKNKARNAAACAAGAPLNVKRLSWPWIG